MVRKFVQEMALKRPALAQDLVPVNEFRSNMADYLRQVTESGRPVVITQRGRAAAVLMDPAVVDDLEERTEVVRRVARGLEDGMSGRTYSTEELFEELESIIQEAEKTHAG